MRNQFGLLTCILATLAFASLWHRSYRRADAIAFFTPAGNTQLIGSFNGRIELFFSSISVGRERGLSIRYAADEPQKAADFAPAVEDAAEVPRRLLGFGFATAKADAMSADLQGQCVVVWCPHWLPLGICAVLALRAVRRTWTQRYRRVHGLCAACGYDLRASAERCPECGAEMASAAPTASV